MAFGNGGNINVKSENGKINTGRIAASSVNGNGGNVTLSSPGNIQTKQIISAASNEGGKVEITSGGNIAITDTTPVTIDSSSSNPTSTGNGGAITLDSEGDITISNQISSGVKGSGTGGNINFNSNSGNLTAGDLNSSSTGGNAGTISLTAPTSITAAVINANGAVDTGNINLTSDEINFIGNVSSLGKLTIEPFSASQAIALGGTDSGSSSTLDITTNELSFLQPGISSIIIGRADGTGTITLDNTATFNSPVNIVGGSTLVGANRDTNWYITDANSGNLSGYPNSLTFDNIENIVGGISNDTFVFNDGINFNGTIDGNLGSDTLNYSNFTTPVTINLGAIGGVSIENLVGTTKASSTLVGTNTENTWNIAGGDTGNFNGQISFSAFQNIIGGDLDDTFQFTNQLNNVVSISGNIDGKAGNLTLRGDEIDFGGNISGTGNLTLEPLTASQNIEIGATDSSSSILDLTANEISRFQNNFKSIVIGRNDGSGAIAFNNPISFNDPVTILSPQGSIAVNATILGIDDASITLAGKTTNLNADITTADRNITINGNTSIGNNVNLSTGNQGDGDITINGEIDGNGNLTLEAGSGNIILNGDIGSNNRFGNLTVNSAKNVQTGAITAASITQKAGTGTTIFQGPIDTNSSSGVNLKGNNFTFISPVTASKSGGVTINNSGTLNIVASADINLDGVFNQNGTGSVFTAGDITTTKYDIKFSGPVTLNGNVNFNLGTATISFGSTLSAGDNPLILTAGEIDFAGAVSGTNKLILQPATSDQNIAIASSNDTTALDFTSAEISAIQPGFTSIVIGRSDSTAAITIDNKVNFNNPVTIQSPVGTGAIAAKGDITTNGSAIELFAAGNITTSNIVTAGGNITLTSKSGEIDTSTSSLNATSTKGNGGNIAVNAAGNITTNDITTQSSSAAGGNITLNSQTGYVQTGNLNATGNTAGGSITVITPVQITSGKIDTSAITGKGGNVTLDPKGDIQVEYINAQGGSKGAGGTVDITTERFFRATGTFKDRNGAVSSISTAGGTGGGAIVIRHGGGPETAFNVAGDATKNGTVGNITSSPQQTVQPGSYFGPFTQGLTQVITTSSGNNPDPGNPNPGNPNPGNPDPGNPNPGNPDPGNPDPGNPDPGNPDPGNPDPGNPDPGNP
ncbi:hypothetical protein LAY57_17515, partial [Argonema antarcticum A004/B2]|uniref:beta strand repeat-containing protein n=1 Tax=Argonema antarcticum TaxID=2942763 RepID=UPI003BB5B0AD|nr:hypothetical protein [Argonema antarcticum A004/B2]